MSTSSCLLHAKLKKLIMYKEEPLTDMKNLLYRSSDDMECFGQTTQRCRPVAVAMHEANQVHGRRKRAEAKAT
jgi:hypothetical protein